MVYKDRAFDEFMVVIQARCCTILILLSDNDQGRGAPNDKDMVLD